MSNARLTLALALVTVLPATGRTQDRVSGDWGAEFRTQRAHINMSSDFDGRGHGHSNYGRTFQMSELRDFTHNGRRISFRIVRDAGSIAFQGTGDDRHAGRSHR